MINLNLQNRLSEIFYSINPLIYPFDNVNYVKIYSPTIYIEKFEEKLKIDIRVNVIKNGRIPDGFIIMDVEMPTQKISNIKLNYVETDTDKVFIENSKHTPFIYQGVFTIDLNSDPYFDREIINESIFLKMNFSVDNNYWHDVISCDEIHRKNFTKELESYEIISKINYSNTILYNDGIVKIPYKQIFKNGEIFSEENYNLNMSFFDFNSSILPGILKIQYDNNISIYSRGYNLSFYDRQKNKKILEIKSNLNKKIKSSLLFDENYNYNYVLNDHILTNDLKGINFYNINNINVTGVVLLKINNINYRFKILKTFKKNGGLSPNISIKYENENNNFNGDLSEWKSI